MLSHATFDQLSDLVDIQLEENKRIKIHYEEVWYYVHSVFPEYIQLVKCSATYTGTLDHLVCPDDQFLEVDLDESKGKDTAFIHSLFNEENHIKVRFIQVPLPVLEKSFHPHYIAMQIKDRNIQPSSDMIGFLRYKEGRYEAC